MNIIMVSEELTAIDTELLDVIVDLIEERDLEDELSEEVQEKLEDYKALRDNG
jgi:hypothetical protein